MGKGIRIDVPTYGRMCQRLELVCVMLVLKALVAQPPPPTSPSPRLLHPTSPSPRLLHPTSPSPISTLPLLHPSLLSKAKSAQLNALNKSPRAGNLHCPNNIKAAACTAQATNCDLQADTQPRELTSDQTWEMLL
ncbi:hypothetical protein HaLaN_06346 [Haematococcus lacustris]|uniref:Uncharacterized protein n=1 Tax=Haematococcus lacustris TaxID=44745 RepID=A0A699YLP1_HAELA|nr:hypothetical protein HaLaN_06346 [Haematococcus lacustris]